MLPDCIVMLIKSFLPKIRAIQVYKPEYYSYDYMRINDWNDVMDVRAYGDY